MTSEGNLRCLSHYTCDQLVQEKGKLEKSPGTVMTHKYHYYTRKCYFFIGQRDGMDSWTLKLQAKQKLRYLVLTSKQLKRITDSNCCYEGTTISFTCPLGSLEHGVLTVCQSTITAVYKSGPEAGRSLPVLLYSLHIDTNTELFFIDAAMIGGQNKVANTGNIAQTCF